jgi:hypothetical protein
LAKSRRPADNRASLIRTAVAGRVAPARLIAEMSGYDCEGRVSILPGCGGISIGVHAGDLIAGWIADHLMPGASAEAEGDPAVPGAFHELACVGNRVRDGAGKFVGIVSGKRGGLVPGRIPPNLISVEAPDEQLGKIVPWDRLILEAEGRGLCFADIPEVGIFNLSPWALDKLPLRLENERLSCDVRAIIPSRMAGAGVGQSPWIGDVEIAGDEVLDGSLRDLRFGDLVAIDSMDGRVSRFHRPGHLTIGIVSHGPSVVPGHGPGLTVVLSGPTHALEALVVDTASIGRQLRDASTP